MPRKPRSAPSPSSSTMPASRHSTRAVELPEDGVAARHRHQSRRGVPVVPGGGAADAGGGQAGRHRQHRLGARLRRQQGRHRLRDRQGRRGADDEGARPRARLQGRARQRHRAGLVRHRDQPRLSREPRKARSSPATSRSAGSAATATSTARCCCSPPTPAASSPARRSWSTAARWSRSGDNHGFHAATRHRGPAPAHPRLRRAPRAAARSGPRELLRAREHSVRAPRAGARQGEGRRPVGAAVAQGIRRHGAADRRLGGDVRGGRALAVRAARA